MNYGRANPWTDQQKSLMKQLRMQGVDWSEVARQCGHPKSSCQTMLSYLNRLRKEGVQRSPHVVASKSVPSRSIARTQMPAEPPSSRTVRTSVLIADAELRGRIELQGLTAGLMGDPIPGRSALDRRAGR